MIYALRLESDLQTDSRGDWLTYEIRPYTKATIATGIAINEYLK